MEIEVPQGFLDHPVPFKILAISRRSSSSELNETPFKQCLTYSKRKSLKGINLVNIKDAALF
jgi:hypothetical protein